MTATFRNLSSIDASDVNSWSRYLYLTIDIDWAHDDVLADTIDIIERYNVSTTWFVTHDTPLLARLRENPSFELGIHPNFNFLIEGRSEGGRGAMEILERLMRIVPEATCVRSHSTTQSSVLLEHFRRLGLTHESNSFIPAQSGIDLRPWKLWSGLTRLPYFWEDDVALLYGKEDYIPITNMIHGTGLKVFDFHPIHVYLNTEDMSRYELSRSVHRSPEKLESYRFNGVGTRCALEELLSVGISNDKVGGKR